MSGNLTHFDNDGASRMVERVRQARQPARRRSLRAGDDGGPDVCSSSSTDG